VIPLSLVLATESAKVAHIEVNEMHRAHLPVESYPFLSGLKGGVAGGIVMVIPALLYGLLTQGSIWYAVNLLGGAGVANWTNPSTADIAAFHWNGLLVAIVIHTVTSLLVGLLYGAMLPMWPRHPILLGGLIAPLIWTGLVYSFLGFVNPVLNARISWVSFTLSQLLFGFVAGLVVMRSGRIRTHQSLPFMLRMGIEAKEFMGPAKDDRS
jgi:hypothetical protein